LDGDVFLSYQDLLEYARGQFDLTARIERIPDKGTRELVADMLNVDPKKRRTAGKSTEANGILFLI
jgi:hypothetical protein